MVRTCGFLLDYRHETLVVTNRQLKGAMIRFIYNIYQFKTLKSTENIYTVEPLHADTSLIQTPLYYGQFAMYRQNSHTFLLKKTSIIRTTDTSSQPQEAVSYKLNLFITDTPGTMCQINIVEMD